MARNKYPEETREKILQVAQRLFYEKGYDNTTIQDIIDGLGGLTKGVIYHHFKSKKDILEQVINRIGLPEGQENWYENWQGENGLAKIKNQLKLSVQNLERYAILYSAEILAKSPRMIGELYLECMNGDARCLQTYVEEGIADGSIQTAYPKEFAEFGTLVMNLWLGLNIARSSREELENKLLFLRILFESLNVPLIDDELVSETFHLFDFIQDRK